MLTVLLAAVLTTSATWSCEDEDARVTQHLEDALVQLQTATPPGLSNEQREARAGLLRDLRRYIDAHEFPRNDGPVTPVFVDDDEHHCAMGALLAWNGGEHLVRSIREKRNLATVPTLVDEPGLGEWLTAHGMTVEEAALVQPSYYVCTPTIDVCRTAQFGQTWMANGGQQSDGRWVTSRFATPDGQCATEPTQWGRQYGAPLGTILQRETGLVKSGATYVHTSWLKCPDPVRVTQAALDEPTLEACIAHVAADDPRALLPSCGDDFGYSQPPRCGDDGRFLGEALPVQGVAAALDEFLTRNNLDGGFLNVDLDALENAAWAHADDGGTVPAGDLATFLTWSGVNAATCVFLEDGGVVNEVDAGVVDAGVDAGHGAPDGGVAVQKPALPDPVEFPLQPRGCSTVAGLGLALTALLLRRRR